MDRNLILAIVLSVLIIVGFQYVIQPYSQPPATQPVTTGEAVSKPEKPAVARAKDESIDKFEPLVRDSASTVETTSQAPVDSKPVKDTRIKIDSPIYEAVLSSVGGRIVSFRLKQYKTSATSDDLVNLYPAEVPDTSGVSIRLTRANEVFTDNTLAYTIDSDQTEYSLKSSTEKRSLTFKATAPSGLSISKTYVFKADTYAIDVIFSITNTTDQGRNYLVTFPLKKSFFDDSQQFAWNSAEILLNGSLKDYYFKDIKGDEELSGQVEWAGLGEVYFLKALSFGQKPASKVTLLKPTKDNLAEILIRYGSIDLPPSQAVETRVGLYLGPKESQALQAAGDNLSRAMFYSNYAVLNVMAEYLMKFLRFCNSGFDLAGIRIPGTHNYGIDIIILTILIKILFIPLTHKSMKSMKRMQDIQPQIAKLKEKFKDDKTALNKATMELFREQKVNPLGSCWPMFLQIPVFIALYQALSYAIELRQASFVCYPSIFLCINDLAAPDPYYVTPILMGATMVLQQWMTPSAGDPMQKKMMLLMPVIFTYMFLSFPSGLVLYWLVSNILSIAQQVITNRLP